MSAMFSFINILKIDLTFTSYRIIVFCFSTAFIVSFFTIPVILFFAKKYKLVDSPDDRKIHILPMPTLGGVAIYTGMIVSLFCWYPFPNDSLFKYLLIPISLLFILGIIDDLKNIPAIYKFILEIILALTVSYAGIRISSFEGLFGIWEIPVVAQYFITVITIVGLTNAFNLIDGIDGLAGSLGFMSLIALGFFLNLSSDQLTPLIAFSFAGGLLAFLYFNLNPAKIFMGDTGSLVMGFVIVISCIRLINVNHNSLTTATLSNSPIMSMGLVFIPLFDMVRVFIIRIWQGKSPFTADKIHIHHMLLSNGFSHEAATQILCLVHGIILFSVYWLKDLRMEIVLSFLIFFMLAIVQIFKHLKPISFK